MTARSLATLAVTLLAACAHTAAPAPAPKPTPAPAPVATATVARPAPVTPTPVVEPGPPTCADPAVVEVEAGRELVRTRGEDGAVAAAERYAAALALDPRCAMALWELGWAEQLRGRWEEAVAAWERLEALAPSYPELAVHFPVARMRRDQARILAALPSADALPPPEETPRDGPTLYLGAVGDVQLGRAWPEERAELPPDDARDVFTAVAERLAAPELMFGNLETVLADAGDSKKCGKKSTKCFAFRVPTAYARTLREVGFDLMSIANNHAGDFGEEGREATKAALDAAGIAHSGPIGDVASLEVKGLKVGMVAFSTGQGSYRIQEIDLAKRIVADVDRTHDLVIVSYHGGAEGKDAARLPNGPETFYGEERGDVRAFARAVVDAGADLVLGHGPHLLRAMELYKGRLVAYSLGNFSSWETFNLKGALGISVILEVVLAPNGVLLEGRLHPVWLEEPGRPRPDPAGRGVDFVHTLSEMDLGVSLFGPAGAYRFPGATSEVSRLPPLPARR